MEARDLDELDRRLVLATQEGLPLVSRPYHRLAESLGCSPELVLARLQHMLDRGVIRRIGAVPNHYALGYVANGMTVWDVQDEFVDRVGERFGALSQVTHCYRRPRRLPDWPFNLFAMVHGKSRDEVMVQVDALAETLGREFGKDILRSHDVLFSSRILKKTGLRIAPTPEYR